MSSQSAFREEVYQGNPGEFETEQSTPWPVSGHKILCDPSGNGLYLIGGWNRDHTDHFNGDSNSFDLYYVRHVWKYNFARKLWTRLKSENPPVGLASHCCCWLTSDQILVYGGSLSTRGILGNSNETHTYNTASETWCRLPTSGRPCPELCGHWWGQAACKREEDLFVATGYSLNLSNGVHMHRLNLRTLIWNQLSIDDAGLSPGLRIRHDLVAYQDKLFVIGGGSDFRRDCYSLKTIPCFDLRSNTWIAVETSPDSQSHSWPLPRQGQACVPDGSKVYVCGGYSDIQSENNQDWAVANVLDDLWTLDLSTLKWSCVSNVILPKPMWFHAADLTADRKKIYLFGGCTDLEYETRSNSLYSWNIDEPDSLESLCWQKVSKTADHFNNSSALSGETLVSKFGISQRYVERILF